MSDRDTEIIANISREEVPDVPPLTPEELVAWMNGKDCPDAALEEMTNLAAGLMLARPPGRMAHVAAAYLDPCLRVHGLGFGCRQQGHSNPEFLLRDCRRTVDPPSEFLPSAFLVNVTDTWNDLDRETRSEHPLVPLVKAWHHRPTPAEPERRASRIFAGQVAKIESSDRRGPADCSATPRTPTRQTVNWCCPASRARNVSPSLPAHRTLRPRHHVGWPRAEAHRWRCACGLNRSCPCGRPARRTGQSHRPQHPLRELLGWLYPNRRPSPAEYWPRLMAAAEALDACRSPLARPRHRQGRIAACGKRRQHTTRTGRAG